MNTICDYFNLVKKQYENNIAVFDDMRRLTYSEFDILADTIAAKIPNGAKRVGIIMEHSAVMVAAIFAVLKSGAAYIPVEPSFPQQRINFMMNDAGADCVITQREFANIVSAFSQIIIEKDLQTDENTPKINNQIAPSDLAYILYTSGSTGKPKGVAVTNANVCHYVNAFRHEFSPTPCDTMLQHSVCTFDIFTEEVFTTLLSGATLAIPNDETKSDICKLMAYIERNNVTQISGFPYLLADMNELSSIPSCLRLLISGGDVLRAAYVTNLIDKVLIYNTYGPSETTVCASYFKCNGQPPLPDGTYPIGKAVLGTKIEISDENGNAVPRGIMGEICIYGAGVSNGYIGTEQVKNTAFVTLPNGEKMYKSGDLGIMGADGNLQFIRRKDMQIMIKGRRVEPLEVENTLCKCDEIKQAVVRPFTDDSELSYMVAYVVPKDEKPQMSKLKKYLARHLPDYMIPEYFVQMKYIPLTPNGKPDIKSLPVVLKAGAI